VHLTALECSLSAEHLGVDQRVGAVTVAVELGPVGQPGLFLRSHSVDQADAGVLAGQLKNAYLRGTLHRAVTGMAGEGVWFGRTVSTCS